MKDKLNKVVITEQQQKELNRYYRDLKDKPLRKGLNYDIIQPAGYAYYKSYK